jgi:prohibitin 2
MLVYSMVSLREIYLISFIYLWFIVDGGHRAVKYSRIFGVQKHVYGEGTHFNIPWLETPIIFDVRAKPRNIDSLTGTKGKESIIHKSL